MLNIIRLSEMFCAVTLFVSIFDGGNGMRSTQPAHHLHHAQILKGLCLFEVDPSFGHPSVKM